MESNAQPESLPRGLPQKVLSPTHRAPGLQEPQATAASWALPGPGALHSTPKGPDLSAEDVTSATSYALVLIRTEPPPGTRRPATERPPRLPRPGRRLRTRGGRGQPWGPPGSPWPTCTAPRPELAPGTLSSPRLFPPPRDHDRDHGRGAIPGWEPCVPSTPPWTPCVVQLTRTERSVLRGLPSYRRTQGNCSSERDLRAACKAPWETPAGPDGQGSGGTADAPGARTRPGDKGWVGLHAAGRVSARRGSWHRPSWFRPRTASCHGDLDPQRPLLRTQCSQHAPRSRAASLHSFRQLTRGSRPAHAHTSPAARPPGPAGRVSSGQQCKVRPRPAISTTQPMGNEPRTHARENAGKKRQRYSSGDGRRSVSPIPPSLGDVDG